MANRKQIKTLDGLCKLLHIELKEGEEYFSEYHQVRDYSDNIEVSLKLRNKPLKRFLTGEHLCWQRYKCKERDGFINITTDTIGEIIEMEIDEKNEYCVDRGSFIGADSTVKIERYIDPDLRRGFFGAGFFYHNLKGMGTVHIKVDGKMDEIKLNEKEKRIVDPDYMIMFKQPIEMKLHTLKGRLNRIINGLYFIEIEGPATFYLDRIVGEHEEKNLLMRTYEFLRNYLSPI